MNVYAWAYLTGAAANQITTQKGILQKIVIGTPSNAVIQAFDHPSANNNQILELAANAAAGEYEFNLRISNGLRIVTTGNGKITVVYE